MWEQTAWGLEGTEKVVESLRLGSGLKKEKPIGLGTGR